MRKYIALVLALGLASVCVLAMVDYNKKKSNIGNNKTLSIDFPFEASDVENIEMYHYAGPSKTEKKVITQSKDIENIYQFFESISIKDKKTESSAGGPVTSFRFNLSDGTSYEVIYSTVAVKSGRIITSDMGRDFFTDANIEANWEMYDYEAVLVEESELPQ